MSDSIQARAAAGQPLADTLVIDAHAHLGYTLKVHSACGRAEGLIVSMDRIGVAATCISAMEAISGDYRWGNDTVIDAVRRFPERFIGYAVINPNVPEDVERELARCLDAGLWAAKIHPSWHNYPPDGPAYQRLYAAMNERGGVVLSHDYGSEATLSTLAARYPRVTFIWGHAGSTFQAARAERQAALLAERPNVYLDTVQSTVGYRHLERLVEVVGAGRLLFGSDVPFVDNAHQVGRVTHADLPDADKRRILGLTMRGILEATGYDVARLGR